MAEYTKTGALIHKWNPKKNREAFAVPCTLNREQNDRFRKAFGQINVSAFVRKLILKAVEKKEKENEANRI